MIHEIYRFNIQSILIYRRIFAAESAFRWERQIAGDFSTRLQPRCNECPSTGHSKPGSLAFLQKMVEMDHLRSVKPLWNHSKTTAPFLTKKHVNNNLKQKQSLPKTTHQRLPTTLLHRQKTIASSTRWASSASEWSRMCTIAWPCSIFKTHQ